MGRIAAMFSPGTPFAERYRIEEEIGRGTFGIVYRAYDFVASCDVALKILNPQANADPKLKHRLRREAKLTSELHNPHCVEVFDVAESADGQAYIAMELLHGEELSALSARVGRLSVDRAKEIVRQSLVGVGEAHRLGIVHRDLKPSNIFVCRSDDGGELVKVLDFGIAKITGTADGEGLSESAKLTMHGTVLGTPVYMSPEQCRGETPTPSSDFYSIGIMAYEMLAGAPPYKHENPVQLLLMHNTQPVPPLPPDVGGTPLAAAVMRALEKDPRKRFRDAAEFAAALEVAVPDAVAAGNVGASEASKPQPAKKARVSTSTIVSPLSAHGTATTVVLPPSTLSDDGAASRRRRLVVVAVALVAMVLLAVGYFVTR